MFLQWMSLTRKQHKKLFWFPPFSSNCSYISSHPGRFYEFFTTMQWLPYYCTFLKSLTKKMYSNLFHQTFIQREFPHKFWKQNLAKCFSALRLCACCSAYQTDKLSRPLRYLAQTAHASISSSASISLSVTACLFIQLELFESLELPWCVSVPAGRDLCVQCLLFSKFWLILCPSMIPKCRANLFKEDTNTLLAATLIAAIPPFSFFYLNMLCLYVFFIACKSSLFCVCLRFYSVSLSACAWPQLHFMQFSHSIVSYIAVSPLLQVVWGD